MREALGHFNEKKEGENHHFGRDTDGAAGKMCKEKEANVEW